ncbi:MAG: hypothetical protein EP343_00605 [Deltaproteobacteria bacterium]|nr:MAG: hypothetical protein EP343_00605 [Deltaproteobacteria bacterium]
MMRTFLMGILVLLLPCSNLFAEKKKDNFCDPIIKRQKYNKLSERFDKMAKTLSELVTNLNRVRAVNRRLKVKVEEFQRELRRPIMRVLEMHWKPSKRDIKNIYPGTGSPGVVIFSKGFELQRSANIIACFSVTCDAGSGYSYYRLKIDGQGKEVAAHESNIPGVRTIQACSSWVNLRKGRHIVSVRAYKGGNKASTCWRGAISMTALLVTKKVKETKAKSASKNHK